MPLVEAGQESGVGRWHTIRLTTLSFYEHLQIKNLSLPRLKSLRDLFDWPQSDFYRVTEAAAPYVGNFHEYLVRGGFPQTAQMESITQAQRLLREDIVDKVLKRDMTALFGVRRVLDQEHTFLYLCMHVGGLLDMADLCANLEVKRPTAQNFIELLEATHRIYRLPPFGYGKDVLRARFKIYLADTAIDQVMERPLFTPAVKPVIANMALMAGDEDIDPSALFDTYPREPTAGTGTSELGLGVGADHSIVAAGLNKDYIESLLDQGAKSCATQRKSNPSVTSRRTRPKSWPD